MTFIKKNKIKIKKDFRDFSKFGNVHFTLWVFSFHLRSTSPCRIGLGLGLGLNWDWISFNIIIIHYSSVIYIYREPWILMFYIIPIFSKILYLLIEVFFWFEFEFEFLNWVLIYMFLDFIYWRIDYFKFIIFSYYRYRYMLFFIYY